MDMRRSQAAKVLDSVRTMLAQRESPEKIERYLSLQFGIEALVKCSGEAHSNAHIDNCGCCAPRWGWVGDTVNIK
jgi:hypothetical protein